ELGRGLAVGGLGHDLAGVEIDQHRDQPPLEQRLDLAVGQLLPGPDQPGDVEDLLLLVDLGGLVLLVLQEDRRARDPERADQADAQREAGDVSGAVFLGHQWASLAADPWGAAPAWPSAGGSPAS